MTHMYLKRASFVKKILSNSDDSVKGKEPIIQNIDSPILKKETKSVVLVKDLVAQTNEATTLDI
jgi:hypothetical protein